MAEEAKLDEGQDATGEGDDEDKLENESETDEDESDEGEGETDEEDEAEKDKAFVEEAWGEMPGEGEEGEEEKEEPKPKEEEEVEEKVEEEEPPDPSAPYNLSDAEEAKKAPFKLTALQFAEVEELWALYLDYTPAYTKLDNYITPVELEYMLKCLNLHTYTHEQLMELVEFCVRPPNEDNHINFDEFVWIVTIRQRDMPQEEEIRLALEVLNPENNGLLDREYVRDTLKEKGYKIPSKQVDEFIKEIDLTNDGTLALEDIVSAINVDLNEEDIQLLRDKINPPQERPPDNIDALIA